MPDTTAETCVNHPAFACILSILTKDDPSLTIRNYTAAINIVRDMILNTHIYAPNLLTELNEVNEKLDAEKAKYNDKINELERDVANLAAALKKVKPAEPTRTPLVAPTAEVQRILIPTSLTNPFFCDTYDAVFKIEGYDKTVTLAADFNGESWFDPQNTDRVLLNCIGWYCTIHDCVEMTNCLNGISEERRQLSLRISKLSEELTAACAERDKVIAERDALRKVFEDSTKGANGTNSAGTNARVMSILKWAARNINTSDMDHPNDIENLNILSAMTNTEIARCVSLTST